MTLKSELGRFGVWTAGPVTPTEAVTIEKLGYGAVWVGGSPPAELDWVEPLLAQTTTLKVATGIVNIWTAAAGPVAESFAAVREQRDCLAGEFRKRLTCSRSRSPGLAGAACQ